MRFAVLAAADSWYARDLVRAGAGDYEIVTLPFSEISGAIGLAGWTSGQSVRADRGQTGGPCYALSVTSAGQDLAEFDAVIVRTMPPGSLEQVVFRMDCLGRYEAAGGVVINPARAIEAAVDKFLTSAKLQAAGLVTPRTIVCQTADDALAAFEQLGGDVVLKPVFGSEGRGITRLDDEALALRAFKMLAQLGAVLYVQEYIEHEGYDIRLLLIGERVLAMRRRNPLDWRTNISRGATAEPFTPDDSLIETARRAAAAVGAPLAGVDLLPGRDGTLYAIEVNAVPGWKGLGKALGVDVARLVLDFVAFTVQNR
ncbi:MAG TPA: RimK family alpha-L-glutamate ligase [Pirellulaceae bacterium]|nr:RimK family alpha-L-glutamate ligase [Pirellulaceae bacterium]